MPIFKWIVKTLWQKANVHWVYIVVRYVGYDVRLYSNTAQAQSVMYFVTRRWQQVASNINCPCLPGSLQIRPFLVINENLSLWFTFDLASPMNWHMWCRINSTWSSAIWSCFISINRYITVFYVFSPNVVYVFITLVRE